jgi:hypothetical protein
MERRIFGIAFQLEDGKFKKMKPQVVGRVLPDGTIENTPYKMEGGKKINGGIAITTHSNLIEDDGDLVNPATGQRFEPTRKGTGYWDPVSKIFIKAFGGKK